MWRPASGRAAELGPGGRRDGACGAIWTTLTGQHLEAHLLAPRAASQSQTDASYTVHAPPACALPWIGAGRARSRPQARAACRLLRNDWTTLPHASGGGGASPETKGRPGTDCVQAQGDQGRWPAGRNCCDRLAEPAWPRMSGARAMRQPQFGCGRNAAMQRCPGGAGDATGQPLVLSAPSRMTTLHTRRRPH